MKVMTKADILHYIRDRLENCVIDNFIYFTVSDWENDSTKVIERIKKHFSNGNLIIRSSSVKEDVVNSSCAGKYLSVKNVPIDDFELTQSINSVINSYEKDNDFYKNQVIVQEYLNRASTSGVLFNYDYRNNKPYYFIEYDDSTYLTDTVTSFGERKSLIINREIGISKINVEVWSQLLFVVNQIERLFPDFILDIEFAVDFNKVLHIFQVRLLRKSVKHKLPSISIFESYSSTLIHSSKQPKMFSNMSDWNPVEMLGADCKPLSSSIYLTLIGDKVWKESRRSLGYFEPENHQLFEMFFNEPFVNVRNSLLSLTPHNIEDGIREKIVNGGITKLSNNPYLHDKIEFEIAASIYFINEKKFEDRLLEYKLSKKEIDAYKDISISNTKWIIENHLNIIKEGNVSLLKLKSSTEEFRKSIGEAKSIKSIQNTLSILISLIKKHGTFEFSRLARLAFIGEQFTNQLREIGIVSDDSLIQFYSSLKTIPKYITEGIASVKAGNIEKSSFLESFGHLRISTYDITSPNYNEIFEVLFRDNSVTHETYSYDFHFQKNGYKFLNLFTIDSILAFAKATIEAREHFKFQFTKAVSLLLDSFRIIANILEIPLCDFQYLKISDIIESNSNEDKSYKNHILSSIESNKKTYFEYSKVKLPDLISNFNDLYFFNEIENKPNYITAKTVQAEAIFVKSLSKLDLNKLSGKIVIIEAMEPGNDWMFLYPVAGIVTKYGGVASHIAIRCKELDLPAVIGCGSLFEKIKHSKKIRIEALNQNIRVIK